MRSLRSLIASLIVLCTVFQFVPVKARETFLAVAPPAAGGDWAEDLSQRTEFQKVSRKEDQTRVALSPTPVHTATATGAWTDIDNTLVPDSGDFVMRNKRNAFTAHFTQATSGNKIRVEYRGKSVTFDLPEDVLGRSQEGVAAVSAHADKAVMSYERAGSPISFQYQTNAAGLTGNIWLARPGARSEFGFYVRTEGVTPHTQPDGSIWFVYNDATTERAFYIPAPFAEDAKGSKAPVAAQLLPAGEGRWLLNLAVDKQWLSASDRAWPLRIVPDLYTDINGGQWLELHSDNSTWYDHNYLEITPSSAAPARTAHMQFNLRDYAKPQNQKVASAYLTVSVREGTGCDRACGATLWLAQEQQEWFQQVASWTQPAMQGTHWSGGAPCTSAPCSAPIRLTFGQNYIETRPNNGPLYFVRRFDVTEMVRQWLDGTVANNGFVLYGSSQPLKIVSPSWQCCTTVSSELTVNYVPAGAPLVRVAATDAVNPTVTVTSDARLIKTELYVDGILAGTNASATPGTFTFPIDASRFPYGTHQLTARTYTNAGQTSDADAVQATLGEGGVTPPVNLRVSPWSFVLFAYPQATTYQLDWGAASASNPNRTITYTLIRSNESAFGTYTEVATGLTATSYTDRTSGAAYYKVKAVTGAGVSSEFTPAATVGPPVQPFALSYRNVANGAIELRWEESPTGVLVPAYAISSYSVYRDGVQIGSSSAGIGLYSDPDVTPGRVYSYYVVAVGANGAGSSPPSDAVRALARAPYSGPEPPDSLRATPERGRRVTLAWTSVTSGAPTFDIYRYTGNDAWADPGNAAPLVAGVSAYAWTDTDPTLQEGQLYWYRVRSVKDGVAGAWSEPAGAVATTVRRSGHDQRQAFVEVPFGNHSLAVNLSSGNLTVSALDSFIPAPYLPQTLQHTYNTQPSPAWRLNADWRVETAGSDAVVVEGDGSEHLFTWSGAQYLPEERYYRSLARTTDGGWSLSFPDLTRYSFRSDGRLRQIQERNGNELRYEYDAAGKLSRISSSPAGRAISFAYDSQGRLTSATDSAGRTTTFAYRSSSPSLLATTTNNAGETIAYSYRNNRLVGLKDSAGRWLYIAYGLNGAVSQLVDGLGNVTRIDTYTAGATAVRDPLDNRTVYTLDSRGWLTRLTDALGNATSWQYLFSGTLLTELRSTNPRGLRQDYRFDAGGRITRVAASPATDAETQDLTAPGVRDQTEDATYDGTTGDLLEQGAMLTGSVAHLSRFAYSYTGTGAYPYRLTSAAASRQIRDGAQRVPAGADVGYIYDPDPAHPGWLQQIQDPNGNWTAFTYNSDGTIASVGKRDIDADLVRAGAAAVSRDLVQAFAYQPDGQVQSVTDWHQPGFGDIRRTAYAYDQAGRLTGVTYPDGTREYTQYDRSGLPVLKIDRAGRAEVTLHDAAGRAVAAINAERGVTRFEYDAAGRSTVVTDPLGHTTRIGYDGLNRVVRVSDPNQMVQAWSYDKAGNITAITTGSTTALNQGKGYTVRASYYLADLKRETREPLPTGAITPPPGLSLPPTLPGDPAGTTYNVTAYQYNRYGQKAEQVDGNGYGTSFAYDNLDRLHAVTQHLTAGELVTGYSYDSNGNQTALTDSRGKSTTYRYDGLNRMWRRTNALGIAEVDYRFSDAGETSQKIEPRQFQGSAPFTVTTNYTYDKGHRLTRVAYQRTGGPFSDRAPDVAYAYDAAGNRVYMWDGYGPTFYQYDAMGRLREERGLQALVAYGYDLASRLVSMNSHLGNTQYGYDDGNRVSWVRDPLGNQTTYTYDPAYGHLTSLRLPLGAPNAITRQDAYYQLSDGRQTNRLQTRTYTKTVNGSSGQAWQGSYTYDLPGMIRSFRDSTGLNQAYSYDEGYRLTQADGASGISAHPNDRYRYDAAGNWRKWGNEVPQPGALFKYDVYGRGWDVWQITDDANRATEINEALPGSDKWIRKTFEYEGNGNLRYEYWRRDGYTNPCGGPVTRGVLYNYDDANRLAMQQQDEGLAFTNRSNRTTLTYDGDGRRLTQLYQQTDYVDCFSANPVWTDYTAYEYANGQVLDERVNGNVPVWYVRAPGGDLLYTLHWRNNQLQPDAYVLDHLGSIRLILDYQGNAANTYTYDAYGAVTSSRATLRNSYTFTGYPLDQRTGLYYARARYYSPALGRFLTQDTWKGSPWQPWTQHLYTYVGNNPINFTDPTGNIPQTDIYDGGGGGSVYNYIFLPGMSADMNDPLIQDFIGQLRLTGSFASMSDYWTLMAGCEGPCRTDVEYAEWTGKRTGLSHQLADALKGEIVAAQSTGQKVVLVGHSMGGTLAANAVLALADSGVRVNGLALLGGAVRKDVKNKVADAGINIASVNNPCDTVPQWSASGSLLNAARLFRAAANGTCHQGPGYFSEGENMTRTIRGVRAL